MTDREFLIDIMRHLGELDYIEPGSIPNIDLYMDQVTTFMDSHLEHSKRYPEDKILTKTMINNYAKNDLLPPPDKKKYSKDHMLMLTLIYYFKNLLSIGDIETLLAPQLKELYFGKKGNDLEGVYDTIYELCKNQRSRYVRDIIGKFNASCDMVSSAEGRELTEDEQEYMKKFYFLCMLGFDVYLKKEVMEKIVDDLREEEQKKTKKEKNK